MDVRHQAVLDAPADGGGSEGGVRFARGFLLAAFLYGAFGAVLAVYVADVSGRASWMRVGAGMVVLAAVAAAGLSVTRDRVEA